VLPATSSFLFNVETYVIYVVHNRHGPSLWSEWPRCLTLRDAHFPVLWQKQVITCKWVHLMPRHRTFAVCLLVSFCNTHKCVLRLVFAFISWISLRWWGRAVVIYREVNVLHSPVVGIEPMVLCMLAKCSTTGNNTTQVPENNMSKEKTSVSLWI
jgi:hypothetical protein